MSDPRYYLAAHDGRKRADLTSNTRMSALMSHHLADIAQALSLAARRDRAAGARAGTDDDRADVSNDLPSKLATILDGRSWIFDDGDAAPASFHVYRRDHRSSDTRFTRTLKIDRDAPQDEQIASAYRAILDRTPDPSGYAIYKRLLQAGTLTVRSILASLASSSEFGERPRDIVLIPDTSQWLSRFDAPPDSVALPPAIDRR